MAPNAVSPNVRLAPPPPMKARVEEPKANVRVDGKGAKDAKATLEEEFAAMEAEAEQAAQQSSLTRTKTARRPRATLKRRVLLV